MFCQLEQPRRSWSDAELLPLNHGEVDLREALRHAADDAQVRALLETALQRTPLEHSFRHAYRPCRPMTAIGG